MTEQAKACQRCGDLSDFLPDSKYCRSCAELVMEKHQRRSRALDYLGYSFVLIMFLGCALTVITFDDKRHRSARLKTGFGLSLGFAIVGSLGIALLTVQHEKSKSS